MIVHILSMVTRAFFFTVFALSLGATSAAAQETPRLSNDRWSEDWSQSDAPFKNIALGPNLWVDFGADARWKFESATTPRFGLTGADDDSWLQQRLLAHANLRAGEHARLFVELGAFDVIGRDSPSSNDDNRFDVSQAFLDLDGAWNGSSARLRIGRQELDLFDRFLDAGDSSNIRRHYEGARFTLNAGPWEAEALSVNPIANDTGIFDDSVVPGEHIYGGFVTRSFESAWLRALYFDHARRSFNLAGDTSNDRRRTFGIGAGAESGPYEAEFEILGQEGDHGAQDVEAWGAYAGLTRSFADAPWSPSVTARVTYGSGDSDPTDGTLETYATPIPRGSWFSEGGFTSHSNIIEAALEVSARPHSELRLDAKLAGLWHPEDGDFVYVSSHTALPGSRGGDEFIGVAPRLRFTWNPARHVTVRGEWTMVAASDRIESLGGGDPQYVNFSVALRY